MKKILPYILIIAIIVIVVVVRCGRKGEGKLRDGNNHVVENTKAANNLLPPDTKPLAVATPIVNIYIENSGSMNGFVTSNSEFKDALGKLLVKTDNEYKGTHLYFVNSDVVDTGSGDDFTGFLAQLNPSTMQKGHTESTNINHIFDLLLSKTSKNMVSVLFSDCVYSIKGDVKSQLVNAKNATMSAFQQAMKKNPSLAVLIMQCQSRFYGRYYDRNNEGSPCNGKRPYYIIMMGDYAMLNKMNQDLDLTASSTGIPGLQHKYLLSSQSWTLNESTAHVITSDFNNAKNIKPASDNLNIKSIEIDRSAGNLQLAFALGVKHLFADESYLLDKANYEIEPADFKLVRTQAIDKSSTAWGDCQGFEHPFALKLTAPSNSVSPQIMIRLKNNLPTWLTKANIDDDAGLGSQMGTTFASNTFGIQWMIEGIYEAFVMKNKNMFELIINIDSFN